MSTGRGRLTVARQPGAVFHGRRASILLARDVKGVPVGTSVVTNGDLVWGGGRPDLTPPGQGLLPVRRSQRRERHRATRRALARAPSPASRPAMAPTRRTA